MCIAIYKPYGVEISKEILKRCYDANPDGAGFITRLQGNEPDSEITFHLDKGYFNFEQFYKALKPWSKNGQCLIHFRIATHGKVNETNSHPHLINDDYAMIHNGVLRSFTGESSDEESDTRVFVRKILTPLATAGIDLSKDKTVLSYIEDSIGFGNKVVILHRQTGKVSFLNERAGDWENQAWFSNNSWKWERQSFSGGSKRGRGCQTGTSCESVPAAGGAPESEQRGPTQSMIPFRGRLNLPFDLELDEEEDKVLDPNELFGIGYGEAVVGYKPDLPGSVEYMRGYREVVNAHKDEPEFKEGYVAGFNRLVKSGNTAVWKLGWEWGNHHKQVQVEFEREEAAKLELENLRAERKLKALEQNADNYAEANKVILLNQNARKLN